MNTTQTERLMALADAYAKAYYFDVGGDKSVLKREALLAALQAREGEAVANSAILARGRFHAFKGEDGEPDDWEWFEEGTNCEHGCIDAVIVRADAIAAPQAAQPEPDRTGMKYYKNDKCQAESAHSPSCICWTPSEPAQPEQGHST